MKKIFFTMLSLCTAILCLNGCVSIASQTEWDLKYTAIKIEIRDGAGNNLLDPDFPDNVLHKDIKLEHDGKTWSRVNSFDPFNPETKAEEVCRFGGLQTDIENHRLVIGAFDQTENFEKDFTLIWDNGQRFPIHLKQEFQWIGSGQQKHPRCSWKLDFNGSEIKDASPFGWILMLEINQSDQ